MACHVYKQGTIVGMQKFREPLYLNDKPVRMEDTRSEEERKYPELFRQKLQGASGPNMDEIRLHS
jgi:hypothetical protein